MISFRFISFKQNTNFFKVPEVKIEWQNLFQKENSKMWDIDTETT